MATKTPLPPRPSAPAATQVPKISGAPGTLPATHLKSLLRVFKPLLILPLLAIAALLVYLFVPGKVGRYDLNFYCLIFIGILTGILVLWVLVRLANYIVGRARIRKQQELLGKQGVARIQESLAEKFERVAALFTFASVGRYEMPWYFILGGQESGARGLLEELGRPSPETAAASPASDPEDLDRWLVTDEAVFIDTTGRGLEDSTLDAEQVEWDAVLDLLVRRRPRCPINGTIVTIPAHELANDPPETRKAKARQILFRVRYIQNRLKIRLPIYLVVTGMESILGFSEYFGGLDEEEKGQMLGWSNPKPPDARLPLHTFSQAFARISRNLAAQRIRRLGGNPCGEAAHRMVLFPEEFACLEAPLGEYVRPLMEESRFAESPIFRGFYFTGAKEPGLLTTLYCQKYLPLNVLAAIGPSPETAAPSRALFVRDLFARKIFLEPELVTRPRAVFRKNLSIKAVGALILSLFILAGTLHLISSTKKWAGEIQGLRADVQQARNVLQRGNQGADMLPLCIRLARHEKQMRNSGFVTRVLGLGRYGLLAEEIGRVHRALFQATALKTLLNQVESGLSQWRSDRPGEDSGFQLFAAALIEYTAWSNPAFRSDHSLDISAFLDFLRFPQRIRHQYLDQFSLYLQEGGKGRVTSPESKDIIRRALAAARAYLRPALPDKRTPAGQLSQAQWWLSLATQMGRIYNGYQDLLQVPVPPDETSLVEMTDRYNEFRGFLLGTLNGTKRLLALMKGGQEGNVAWIAPGAFYDRLLSVSEGMAGLATAVDTDRQYVVADYNERVVARIVRLAPVLNLLDGHPSCNRLFDVLVRALGPGFSTKFSDQGAGYMTRGLLAKVADYDRSIQDLETSFDPWMNKLPLEISTLNDSTMPLKTAQLDQQRSSIQQSRQALDAFATKAVQTGPPAAPQKAGILPSGTDGGNQKGENAKAAISFWEANTLCSRISQWLEVQDRVRMYAESRYLEEILTRAEFAQSILNTDTWRELKNLEVFRKGDGVALVTPISEFLNRWVQSIPAQIRISARQGANAKHYPEMNGFEKKIEDILLFQGKYMENLRMSANNFAKCVQAMDMDAAAAWQALREAPPPDQDTGQQLISWKNLQSFTRFKESLEMEKGPVDRFITDQLGQIQTHVLNLYRTELIDTCQGRIAQLFEKYDQLGIADQFPFRLGGPPMSAARMATFFDDLNAMNRDFMIDQGPYRIDAEGKKVPLYSMARSIAMQLGNEQWRHFCRTCSALSSFLFEKGTPCIHKFEASLVPGPIGSYFHWLRISSGNGTFEDIDVYGKPAVEMNLGSGGHSVTIQGLDAAKTPQVTKTVAQGNNALLQMIYHYGRPTDEQRTTWLVNIDIPTSDNASSEVNATFKFVFKEGLPNLPVWKNFRPDASMAER